MKKIILRTIFFLTLITSIATSAQVGIGTAVPNGALDITSTTDGLIIPRVALTALNSASPLTAPIISELVYNTGTSLSPAGFFYWDGAKWVQLITGSLNWNILGNTGLSGTTNFIGTTDNVDVAFRRSNTAAGKIGATSIAFGVNALNSGVSTNSTAIGNNALKVSTGNDNVAVGQNALLNCASTAQWNTAIGSNALQGINSNAAQNNTAVGYNAMSAGTGVINQCTSVGSKALFSNTADNNTAIGFQALQGKGAGTENTAVGCKALNNASNVNQCTALGSQALFNATGSNNTGVGFNAGTSIGAGTNNTCIGVSSDVTAGISNATAIGSGAVCTLTNTMKFGNAAVTNNYFSNTVNAVTFTASSDIRYKKDITPIVPSLSILTKLIPVNYYFKTKEELQVDQIKSIAFSGDITNERQIGFIAQEVEKIVPEVVHTDNEGYKSIDYSKFSPFIIKAIQEQQQLIEQLEKANEAILKRLELIEKKL
jgi:hypothetical protein